MSRLIQASDVSGRETKGHGDGIVVYLISRLKEKQVLTIGNLFCTAQTEDRLAVSVDVCSTFSSKNRVHLHVLCTYSISMRSPFAITIIKARINNKRKEMERLE